MTEAMLERILGEAKAQNREGEWTLAEERRLTLYASHKGVGLTITHVEGVRIAQGGLVVARNTKGERYFVELEDLFAVGAEGVGPTGGGRKAGFI